MKKILLLICMLIVVLSFSQVYAYSINVSNQKIVVDGVQKDFEVYNIDGYNYFKLRDIAYVLNDTGSQFSVDFNSEKNLIETSKGKPYSPVGGEMKAGVDNSKMSSQSPQKLLVDGEAKEFIAYNIANNNFFKLRDLGSVFNFEVGFDAESDSAIITSAKKEEVASITNVVAKIYKGIMYVEVSSDNPISKYNVFALEEPNRVILDIPNSRLGLEDREILVNYNGLDKVRIGDQGNSINRIVLDVDKTYDYQVAQSTDKKTTCIALSSAFVLNDALKDPDRNLYVYNGSILGLPEDNNTSSGDTNKNDDNLNDDKNNESGDAVLTGDEAVISKITYSSSSSKLKINANKKISCKASKSSDPRRLIIDIENAILDVEGPTSIKPSNRSITEIKFSQEEVNVVRIILELNKDIEYKIKNSSKSIEITLIEAMPGDIRYELVDDVAQLVLFNVDMDVFSVVNSVSSSKYTIKYDTEDFDAKIESRDIYDDFVENIEIKSGKIVIYGKDGVDFEMKQDGDNTVVVISKEKSSTTTEVENKNDGNFVVLLDAGHGGSDPGACNSTDPYNPEYQEKTYNLAIMLKLKELLENTEGITVYASRTTDEYIDRNGRLSFATSHPEASLYVSVHNNSSSNKNYTGTLVLYHDNEYEKDYGITSKEFAQIVSKELVNDLGTRSWGVADNLEQIWVLYYSKLPSILCEVSFVSNDEELARLKTEEYQQAAATAIYNGILKAKEQMGK